MQAMHPDKAGKKMACLPNPGKVGWGEAHPLFPAYS